MVIATGPAPGSEMNVFCTSSDAGRNRCGALAVAAIFDSHMVLQRDKPITVFGTLAADVDPCAVTVALVDTHGTTVAQGVATALPSLPNGQYTDRLVTGGTTSDARPETPLSWSVTLPALHEAGPYIMRIHAGADELIFEDVLAGEVWLAGGQSNMEVELRNSDDAERAVSESADPLLRFINVPKTGVVDEAAECAARWRSCSPETSGAMSAVAYYFARKLRRELGDGVPVGIVDCYIGGTSATCWMSRETLETCAAGRDYLQRFEAAIADKTAECFATETTAWQTRFDAWNANIAAAREANPDVTWDELNARYGVCPWPPPVTPTSQWRPAGAFGAMLQRIAPHTLAGFLWYRGEEDEAYCESYRELLGLLIGEWRDLWHDAALPFLIAQLPQWIDKTTAETSGDPMRWPVLREAQCSAAREISRVFTVSLIDCGEFDNIHPTDKRTPGERLADCALRWVYGRKDVAVDGPSVARWNRDEYGRVALVFSHACGLHFDGTDPDSRRNMDERRRLNQTPLIRQAAQSGFELAGADGVFHPTQATIVTRDARQTATDDLAQITLSAEGVDHPTAVRYAWHSWGPAPLFNAATLPAPPFKINLVNR